MDQKIGFAGAGCHLFSADRLFMPWKSFGGRLLHAGENSDILMAVEHVAGDQVVQGVITDELVELF